MWVDNQIARFNPQLDASVPLQRQAFIAAYEDRYIEPANQTKAVLTSLAIYFVTIRGIIPWVAQASHLAPHDVALATVYAVAIEAPCIMLAGMAARAFNNRVQRLAFTVDAEDAASVLGKGRVDTLRDAYALGRYCHGRRKNDEQLKTALCIAEGQRLLGPYEILTLQRNTHSPAYRGRYLPRKSRPLFLPGRPAW